MTAKEKAEELYWKYYQLVADGSHPEEKAKESALIAAEEIKLAFVGISHWEAAAYWRNVEQELEKP